MAMSNNQRVISHFVRSYTFHCENLWMQGLHCHHGGVLQCGVRVSPCQQLQMSGDDLGDLRGFAATCWSLLAIQLYEDVVHLQQIYLFKPAHFPNFPIFVCQKTGLHPIPGWWFRTWMLFFRMSGSIIPSDIKWLILFRGVETTNQLAIQLKMKTW